ncbi:MAG: tRNA guanosine(34) transglycosylase Tgt [Puniceicoccales bacterium]|jgi:queuine tRNA-ribosyltransferase|nr:tRNA guanosine(34) transglycosylase Tgt [Puniceicoccales bacterium]
MAAAGSKFSFEILKKTPDGARRGRLTTPHGTVETPAFFFCGTRGSVKGLCAERLVDCGTQAVLANTYHLHLRPGEDTVALLGGLHAMMGWPGPMLTDSGGFQIFSLGHGGVAQEIKCRRTDGRPKTLLRIDENGALFRSYVDGSFRTLTPESSIRIQKMLGADILLPLDECTPYHADRDYTARSLERSHRWELRSLAEFQKISPDSQALYGIVQGGIYEDLRRISCDFIAGQDFFGQAIGGSLGGDREEMERVVATVGRFLHPLRPTHLLGIGGLRDIFHGVRQGVDTFDCVHPTRMARHGGALVPGSLSEGTGRINLHSGRFARDREPIDASCDCYACRTASRAYLHHLLRSREILGGQLVTIHNVRFMNRLMERIREAIGTNSLDRLEAAYR